MHFVFKYRLIENGKFGHFLFFHLCLCFNAEDYLQMKTIIKSTQHTKRYAIFSINTDKYQIPIYGDFNPLYTGNPLTSTLANSEDPDEMQHYAAFHQDSHCLLRQKRYTEGIITCDP